MVQVEVGITNKIADLILEGQEKEYSSDVVQQFKRTFIDYLCSAVTGANEPAPKQLVNYLGLVEKGETPVIGHSIKLSPSSAAFINGTSAHSLDFDDGHTHGSIHLGGVIFPAVLAVAHQYDLKPAEVIRAVITGYEVGGRLSAALHPHVWQRGYHNTPVIGIFGAVAALAVLLKCNRTEILDALGQAGSFSGGLFEFLGEGADVKRLHPGKAARDAIICVEMARRNITGPKKVFEGKNGFIRAFADNQINVERLFKDLDTEDEIKKVYFKPYPCCRHLHGPIEAAISLMNQHNLSTSDISDIEVGSYKVASKHNHYETETLLDAQMSIPCAITLAFVYGDVTIETFSKDKLDSDEVQQLIRKVRVVVNDECEEIYPRHRSSYLTVTLKNGQKLIKHVEDPKGESHTPLTDQELEGKFLNNGKTFLSEVKINEVIKAVWNFEDLDSLEVFNTI